ncbi:MAG TPA: hypothetical protein VK512_22260 [Xanthobacteraceae bacterium]|jgi:hypothetical protein|nr:hypothetical protein [Xanthobacteraceae bacterium]
MQSWRARLAALFEATEASSPKGAGRDLRALTICGILERLPLLFARQARDCDIRAIESGLDQRHPGGIEH